MGGSAGMTWRTGPGSSVVAGAVVGVWHGALRQQCELAGVS